MHPLSKKSSRVLRLKKKLKKVAKKFGKKKKGSTFAAPKNETSADSKASGGRSEGGKEERHRNGTQVLKYIKEVL